MVARRPTPLSAWVAGTAGLASVVSSGFTAWIGLGIAVPGLALLIVGIHTVRPRLVSVGALGLVFGGLAAGITGAPTIFVLVSVGGSVLAWDLGRTAISLGRQLGSEADTKTLELVHATGSLVIGISYAGLAVGLSQVSPPTSTPTGLLVLLVASLLFLRALGHSTVGT